MPGRLLVMAITLLVLSGCSLLLKEPRVAFKDIGLTGLDKDGVTLELLLAVHNDNAFDLSLRGYRYDLHLMALPLASGNVREAMAFKHNAVTDVRLPVRFGYRELMELLKRRPDPDKIPYRLTADFELETPLDYINQGGATWPVSTR